MAKAKTPPAPLTLEPLPRQTLLAWQNPTWLEMASDNHGGVWVTFDSLIAEKESWAGRAFQSTQPSGRSGSRGDALEQRWEEFRALFVFLKEAEKRRRYAPPMTPRPGKLGLVWLTENHDTTWLRADTATYAIEWYLNVGGWKSPYDKEIQELAQHLGLAIVAVTSTRNLPVPRHDFAALHVEETDRRVKLGHVDSKAIWCASSASSKLVLNADTLGRTWVTLESLSSWLRETQAYVFEHTKPEPPSGSPSYSRRLLLEPYDREGAALAKARRGFDAVKRYIEKVERWLPYGYRPKGTLSYDAFGIMSFTDRRNQVWVDCQGLMDGMQFYIELNGISDEQSIVQLVALHEQLQRGLSAVAHILADRAESEPKGD